MPGSAGVAITTVLSIFVILGILGNSLVCAIIKKNRDMRYFDKITLCILYLRVFSGSMLKKLRIGLIKLLKKKRVTGEYL